MTNMIATVAIMAATNGATSGLEMMASSLHELRLQAGGRLSKISETVAVVTNVVKADNGVPGWQGWSITTNNCIVIAQPAEYQNALPWQSRMLIGQPATERTETTTVTERRTLRFRWSGEWRELTAERELERKVRRWVKSDRWEER